jgi:LPXTG-motif cell wall-anchored protein
MKKLLVCSVVAVVAALAWNVSSASAHHPEVVVTTDCPDGVPTIEVTAYAWTDLPPGWGTDHRVNNNIRIDVDGPGVDLTASGAFAAPDYSFTVGFDVPVAAGTTLTVRATSVGPWGPNGEYGSTGEYRETTVTVEPPCEEGGTTTTTAPPTTTVAPGGGSTSVPPTPTTATPTTIPTDVGGIVEIRPQVPDSGDNADQLAFTGTDSTNLLLAGVGLLAAGAGLVLSARRREA